jgi:hypothetical protein
MNQPLRELEPGLVAQGMMHRLPDHNEHEVVVAAVAAAAAAVVDSCLFNSVSDVISKM